MIEINLLPQEIKKKKRKIKLPDISFLPIVAGLLGVIVVIHLLLGITLLFKVKTLGRLEKKWEIVLPDSGRADNLKTELTNMRAKVDAIDALIKNRQSWARRLNDMSDAMISGVWLNRLWLERRIIVQEPIVKADAEEEAEKTMAKDNVKPERIVINTMHLSGSAIVSGGEETATIGRFIRSLKENRDFFADFKEIESAFIQRAKLKEEEIMDFELIGYFK